MLHVVLQFENCVLRVIDHLVTNNGISRILLTSFLENLQYTVNITNGECFADNPVLVRNVKVIFTMISFLHVWFSHMSYYSYLLAHGVKICKNLRSPNRYDVLKGMRDIYVSKLLKCKNVSQANEIRNAERRKLNALGIWSYDSYWNDYHKSKEWDIPKKPAYVDHLTLEIETWKKSWRVKKCTFGHIYVNTCDDCNPGYCKKCNYNDDIQKCFCGRELNIINVL